MRAAVVFAAGYALWLPLQSLYTRLVASAAGPILRLVDEPPLVTSLVARGDSIELYSYLTGFAKPMAAWSAETMGASTNTPMVSAAWSAETMGVFVLAPVVLVLAAPVGRWSTRLAAAAVVLALVFCVSVGIAVTQIQIVVQAHAEQQLGIDVHTAARQATLGRFNDALHVIGMLALPAFVFLATYAYGLWLGPGEDKRGRSPVSLRSRLVVSAVAAVLAVVAWMALASVPEASTTAGEYHEGWAEVLRLNPDFVPAQVNVALHLESTGRIDEAVDLYRSALSSRPEAPAVHYNLGNALRKQGRYEQAVESYGEVLRLAPEHAAAHRNLG
ncbi:MAG: tetratricopeptide repeat protein, partial [Planctomycetota bacterium]